MSNNKRKKERGSGDNIKYQYSNKRNSDAYQIRNRPYGESENQKQSVPHAGSFAGELRSLLSDEQAAELDAAKSRNDVEVKKVKRKMALLLGYSGKGLQGMQINRNALTVEAELERALYLAGAITNSNFGYFSKVSWTRAARTDRGVHAVGNVISLKVEVPQEITAIESTSNEENYNQIKLASTENDSNMDVKIDSCIALEMSKIVNMDTLQSNFSNEESTFAGTTSHSIGIIKSTSEIAAYSAGEDATELKSNSFTAMNVTSDSITGLLGENTASAIDMNSQSTTIIADLNCRNCDIDSNQTSHETSSTTNDTVSNTGTITDATSRSIIATDLINQSTALTNVNASESTDLHTNDMTSANKNTKNGDNKGKGSSNKKSIEKNSIAFEEIRSSVNKFLPAGMEVLKIVRVPNGFNAKNSCTSRRYGYILPTCVFMSAVQLNSIFENAAELHNQNNSLMLDLNQSEVINDSNERLIWSNMLSNAKERVIESFRGYRISVDVREKLKNVLGTFRGTKNYHNYTVRRNSHDASSKRIIRDFTVGHTSIHNGFEWIQLFVEGQSFMLHQIRKMVAMCVDVVRDQASIEDMNRTFTHDQIIIGISPSCGLFLDKLFFKVYQKNFGTSESTSLDWSPGSVVDARVQNYRNRIVSDIVECEEARNAFFEWLFDMYRFPKTYQKVTDNGNKKAKLEEVSPSRESEQEEDSE